MYNNYDTWTNLRDLNMVILQTNICLLIIIHILQTNKQTSLLTYPPQTTQVFNSNV